MTATPELRVELIRWPAEQARREACLEQGVIRLLVVEGAAQAPVCTDVREDWVRSPVGKADLRARMEALLHKNQVDRRPTIDSNGILQYGESTTTLSPTEANLMRHLIESFTCTVDRSLLSLNLVQASRVNRNALDLHVMRIRRRIRPLGLKIRKVWGRGYALLPIVGDDS